jgi:cobalt/nickel transport system ATP-binding protein
VTALEVQANAIAYRGAQPVLRDVAFSAHAGEVIAVLGGNGAGKTALLHWIAGLLPRTGGYCRVNGHAIRSVRDAVEHGIGLVVQDPNDQLLGTTVLDDASIGPRNLGVPREHAEARARHALHTVALAHLAHREVETLSLGERKRASLAGVLAMRPRILLLDEPTAGLDPDAERGVCTALSELSTQGITQIIATHSIDLVPRFASRALVLAAGRVAADGPCRDVLAREHLLEQARLRRPWPTELWARALSARTTTPPLTMEELLPWLTTACS